MATDKDTARGKSSPTGAASKGAGPSGAESAKSEATGAGAKRPVTIDLKPEKVAAKPADKPAEQAPAAAKASEAKSEGKPEAKAVDAKAKPKTAETPPAGAKPSGGSAEKPAVDKKESKPADSSAGAKVDKTKESETKTKTSAAASSLGRSSSAKASSASSGGGGHGFVGLAAAAIFGGVVVLSGAYGLYVSGLLKPPGEAGQETTAALGQAEARISDLERKLTELAARLDPRSLVTDLSDRISALEEAVPASAGTSPEIEKLNAEIALLRDRLDSLPTKGAPVNGDAGSTAGAPAVSKQLQDRLAAAEAAAKVAQTAVSTTDASMKALSDSQARASGTLATLSSDIKTLTTTGEANLAKVREQVDALSKRLAAVEATMGNATAREVAARALSVSALKSAVDSGRPFETELAAVKAGLPKDMNLSALDAHAKTGVAPASVLIAEFPNVARKMFAAFSAPDQSSDLLDSLVAGAKSLVAVRGPGDENGTGPEADLRRMENAVSQGDLAASLASYKQLPEAARSAGADWVSRAEARVEVDRMTEAASKEVLSMLAGKDS